MGERLGIDPAAYNPYELPTTTDPNELLQFYLGANAEQQAQIYENYVEADMRGNDTSPYTAVMIWLRINGPT